MWLTCYQNVYSYLLVNIWIFPILLLIILNSFRWTEIPTSIKWTIAFASFVKTWTPTTPLKQCPQRLHLQPKLDFVYIQFDCFWRCPHGLPARALTDIHPNFLLWFKLENHSKSEHAEATKYWYNISIADAPMIRLNCVSMLG